jgi:methionine synthase II (cobalamin-independent)
MRVGDKDILIPTSMVGNYPNPRWYDAAQARVWAGDQYPPDSFNREAFEDATLAVARDQEVAGLDIISDGRIQADNYADQAVYYYHKRLGYKMQGGYLAFPIYSRLHASTLDRKIERQGPIMVEQARALRQATDKPIKIQYTGPQVLGQTTNNLHYDTPRAMAMDLAAALNEDILEVDALGVDFIQIDEFTWPYFWEDWAVDAFNRTVQGVKNAKIIVHVCWGNWGGTPAYVPNMMGGDSVMDEQGIYDLSKRHAAEPDATGSIIPKVYETNIDVLNLESAGRRADDMSGVEVIKNNPLPENVSFWAGVLDVKSTITETAEEVRDRILRLAQFVDPAKLGVTTDCGMSQLPRFIATQKLHAMAAGAELARQQLGG